MDGPLPHELVERLAKHPGPKYRPYSPPRIPIDDAREIVRGRLERARQRRSVREFSPEPILGASDREKPFSLLPVGYATADCVVPDIQREPLDQLLSDPAVVRG